ncbi:hypothetical protein EBO15_31100 [Actinomadura harenae]|uniref:Uncharacterized protein n=1 Tax=Actinomadura harenae TaxID=2483351 RepID=A0A3M2LNK8_9ACTN|nr:hypothetical protein EBO15_31100 [Actinomadura harenae]
MAGVVAGPYAAVVTAMGFLTWTDPESTQVDYIPLGLLVDLPLGQLLPGGPFTGWGAKGYIVRATAGGLIQAAALGMLVWAVTWGQAPHRKARFTGAQPDAPSPPSANHS